MRKRAIALILLLAAAAVSAARAQEKPDEKLLQQAKLLIFDKKWSEAAASLDRLLEDYPDSPLAGPAWFYRGKSLGEQAGRERDAIRSYKAFLERAGSKDPLAGEAEGGIVDAAYRLFASGADRSALSEVTSRLKHPDRLVRFYAAYKLSQAPDKADAAAGIPVLREFAGDETEPELRDRAKIALLRVSPRDLDEVERRPASGSGEDRHARPAPKGGPRMFRIEITEKGKREPSLRLNLPWALADLVIQSMPDNEKAELRRKGYDMNRILSELDKSGGTILEIQGDDSVIKIWID